MVIKSDYTSEGNVKAHQLKSQPGFVKERENHGRLDHSFFERSLCTSA
jgi:hypothetical protein